VAQFRGNEGQLCSIRSEVKVELMDVEDEALLGKICKEQGIPPSVLNRLLELEQDLLGMGRRHGLNERIAEILESAVDR